MYLTTKELAAYLDMSEQLILQLIYENKIRAVHDGQQYLINKEQFNQHLKQVEKVKELIEEWKNEPIPESPDVKDED
ncbi:excisionase family DNA-binding protein [Jeotgalibacillus haloalkalitolerans]|uniref:Excisionase family DNA-binding protein n=1 Tax=Jeotgalibacillus haloalkalitolerans TaxID=3104292 RepID=A0ABU5KIC4_9BACL|nr:excisionase family DNA-binding protein [Jeotgalibacillus sp. HH7-29]MDZ5710920.1 excisionase family DNA-binding protein [Jeotgalibacillus sp. HH7-29]